MKDPSGIVAVVTGASRGLGRGVAVALGEKGATVYVTGRTVKPGDSAEPGTIAETAAAVTAAGGMGIAVACDHSDDSQVQALFGQVERESGRIDLLVNNAAHVDAQLATPGNFWEKPLSLSRSMDVGLRSNYVAAYHAAPLMVKQRRGLIVNISFYGCYFYGPAYGATKAGTNKMAADMAVDLRPFNVAAVSFWPGFLATHKIEPLRSRMSAADFQARFGHFETPEFSGRVIAALLQDPELMSLSGQTLIGAELGQRYGITEADGRQPRSYRDTMCAPPPPSPVVIR